MNELAWNVLLLGKIDGRLAVGVTSPLVTRDIAEQVTGGKVISYIANGYGDEAQAMAMAESLCYDVLYRVVLQAEVIA